MQANAELGQAAPGKDSGGPRSPERRNSSDGANAARVAVQLPFRPGGSQVSSRYVGVSGTTVRAGAAPDGVGVCFGAERCDTRFLSGCAAFDCCHVLKAPDGGCAQ